MKIAVAYKNGMIHEHFGHCDSFAIYEFRGFDVSSCKMRLIDTGDKHGHEDLANLMKAEDVDAVICGNIGADAKDMLLNYGILPLAGHLGSADLAVELFITGKLPVREGSCSGSCGSCGGCGDE